MVMLTVAALSTWRHHELDQTSWRGASVGMFAQVDAPSNRLVRGVVETRDPQPGDADATETRLLRPPPAVASAGERALVTPTDHNLRRLAEGWRTTVTDGRLLRVEVWATRFRASNPPAVRLELLGSYELETATSP